MARLVLGVAGAVVGGMIGGPTGAKIGWAVGSTIGAMADQPDGPDTYGPRLGDLSVQSSARGAPIPTLYGTMRLAGNVIWSAGIKEHRHEEDNDGGKGGPDPGTTTTYTYTCTFAIGICEGEIDGIRKIWADSKLIFDASSGTSGGSVLASSNTQFEVYLGSETQEASPTIQADKGINDTPAYRGLAYIVLNDLQLEKYGNRIPNITCEVVSVGAKTPVYSSDQLLLSATGNLQNAYFLEGSGVYVIDCERQGNNLIVKELFIAPGATPVERNRFVHYLGSSFSVTRYVPRGKSDEDGYFLERRGGGKYWPIYYPPNREPISFANIGSGSNINLCVKNGDNFWFYTTIGPQGLKKDNNVMIWPDTITNGTITNIYGIRATRDYFFLFGEDSVDGYVVVRYPVGSLSPLDYIYIDSTLQVDVNGSSDVTYATDGVSEIRIHKGFAQAYDVLAIPDGSLRTASWIYHWNMWLLGDGAYITWRSWYQNNGQLKVGRAGFDSDAVSLSSIVSDLCIDSGLSSSEIDVTELSSIAVRGYVRSVTMTARASIAPLLQAYNIVARESDNKIKFSVMDGAVDKAVDADHLAAHEYGGDQPDDLAIVRQQEQELPRSVSVAFIDPGDDYQQGLQHAQRIAS